MTTTKKKVYLSQDRINQLTDQLIAKIKASRRDFSVVVGIENGGVHVSEKVAEALHLPHRTVKISHYDDDKFRPEPYVRMGNFEVYQYNSCLIVDDLVDKGATLETFKSYFGMRSQDAVAVLLSNPEIEYQPDFFAAEKPKAWVVFPWEVDNVRS